MVSPRARLPTLHTGPWEAIAQTSLQKDFMTLNDISGYYSPKQLLSDAEMTFIRPTKMSDVSSLSLTNLDIHLKCTRPIINNTADL